MVEHLTVDLFGNQVLADGTELGCNISYWLVAMTKYLTTSERKALFWLPV